MKVMVTGELDVEIASTIRKQKEMLSVHVFYEQASMNGAAQGLPPMIGAAQITGGSSHLCYLIKRTSSKHARDKPILDNSSQVCYRLTYFRQVFTSMPETDLLQITPSMLKTNLF